MAAVTVQTGLCSVMPRSASSATMSDIPDMAEIIKFGKSKLKTEINGIISCIYEWVNNVKIPIGPKTIYRFNASLMKVSIKFKQK